MSGCFLNNANVAETKKHLYNQSMCSTVSIVLKTPLRKYLCLKKTYDRVGVFKNAMCSTVSIVLKNPSTEISMCSTVSIVLKNPSTEISMCSTVSIVLKKPSTEISMR
jgi:hypothetical protein